jgi:hypothetical protein
MIFFCVLAGTAALISLVAGWFSITGLAAIFPAAPVAVMVMGAALELGKLVSASWLYRFWGKSSRWIRGYLVLAVFVLSGITSLGIFGFLSKSHIDGSAKITMVTEQVSTLDEKIGRVRDRQHQYQIRLDRLNDVLNSVAQSRNGGRRIVEIRQAQSRERVMLDSLSRVGDTQLDSLMSSRSSLSDTQTKQNAELGPLVFMADLLYSDTNQQDKAVRLLILTIMLVFDPLAILLVIAANIQLASLKRKEITEVDTSFDTDNWFQMVDDPLTNRDNSTSVTK